MKNYPLSKDYAKLFDLTMAGQSIVCFSDGEVYQTAKKLGVFVKQGNSLLIAQENKEFFIRRCEEENISFIDPGATEELAGALREVLGNESSYPTTFILTTLIDAANTLLHRYSYDGHGYEIINHAIDEGNKRIESFNNIASELLKKYGVEG